jgi:amino acid permease
MKTNSTPAEKLATANKSVRNWIIAFAVSAALCVAAENQNVILTAAMLFTVVMSLLAIHKREQALFVPIPVQSDAVN